MKSRFLSGSATLAIAKVSFLLLFAFFSAQLFAQQDSIKITGIVQPTCACTGSIDITVTGGGPSQPPSTNYKYFWSNGASTEDLSNLCPGQYCVTVSNGNINTITTVKCFVVTQIPYTPLQIISSNTAPCNFDSTSNSDCEKVCPGTTVTYSVEVQNPNGAGSQVNWQVSGASNWVVNPGNSPFSSSVTVTWGGPGTGSVRVFKDATGGSCQGEAVLCVTVIEAPKAAFSSSPAAVANGPLQVCLGQIVHFQNLSTGGADSYEWLFSDNLSISSAENPLHTYLIPGIHTVRLIARSTCLCADTTLMTIEVLDAQAPTLDCIATVCPGETVTYTASNGCAPFSWTVSSEGTILNGGTPQSDSISVQWNGGPAGTITLGAQACSGATCPVGGIIEIPIITSNAQISGQENVCPGATEVYTIEPFGGTSFVWTLPNGGNIVDGQGTNRVTVVWYQTPNPAPAPFHMLYVQYENCYLGCGGADFINVRILPSFILSGPVEVCLNSTANYNAKLTGSNAPILCNWTLTSPNGSITWTSPAPTSNPSVPFLSTPGVYRLFAIPDDSNLSCTSEADWSISVPAIPVTPVSIAGASNICPGTTYTYEATGLSAGANIRWTINNGPGAPQTLNGNPVNVTWGNAGPYWLTAVQVSTNGLGCLSDTVGLVATAIASPAISGDLVVCEDTKGNYSMLNLQNVDIQWSISPPTAGAIASGQGTNQVEVFWSQAGGYVVNATVCGQSGSTPVTILANPAPVIQSSASICPGTMALAQTVSNYAAYVWKDESGAILSNTATLSLSPGVYSIEVVDANGCMGASEFEIATLNEPTLSLTTADQTGFCNNSSTVSLTALTNTSGNYVYQWFQDGNPIAGATNSTYFTNQYGTYTVQATNAFGCTTTAGSIVLFNYCGGGGGGSGLPGGSGNFCAPGVVDLVPDPSARCDSFHLVLNDLSGLYIPGSAVWTTGISGGAVLGTATGDEASFMYPNAGKYIVLVQVSFTNGTTCVLLDSNFVNTVARFDEMIDCPGALTGFENQSEILPNVTISNYDWSFGDPASGINNISSLENPAHAFSPAGVYDVTLTVTTSNGCTASLTKTIEIPDSDPPVFADPVSTCAGNALEFVAAANPNIIGISWDFGDPGSGAANDAGGKTVYHFFSPGTYTVTATSSNVYGCTASFTRSLTIQPNTLSGNISPANPGPICEGSSITLTAPAGAVSYLWSDGSNTTTQTLTTDNVGSYSVTLTDANGCTYSPPPVNVSINPAPDALIKALIFNELGQVIGNAYPSISLCAGEDVALQAISNGASTYTWSGGNGSNSVIFFTDDRNSLLPVGTNLYSLTVTSVSTGCTAVSDPFLVTVNPVPSGFSISSATICAGSPNVLNYTGPTPANWQFFWNTGASGTTLTTEDPGSYYIRVINEFGCESKSNVLAILPGPQVSSIPAGCHTRCSPDTLCIPNLPNISSWQWFLDGSPIPGATSPNFVAQQSGTYWAELTDIFGCTGESDPLSLNLLTGYGNILGQVWSDVNNNGIIDAADTLLSGVTVVVYQNGNLYSAETSGVNGDFALTNVLSTDYTFVVDPFSLPPNWSIVIGNDQTTLSGCNVVGDADLLLHFGCQAFGTLQLAACPGGFATYNGTNISVGGTQSFHLTSPQGCDSTVVVNVVALPPTTSALTLKACPGGTVNYNGSNLAIGAVQPFTLQNALGCDSIVTVTVTEADHFVLYVDGAVCKGSFIVYQGQQIPPGTEAIFTQVNADGCLDTTIVSVSEIPPHASTLILHACPDDSADYYGTNLAVGAVELFTLKTPAGCDSLVLVKVMPWPTASSAFSVGICPGETYNYQGTTLNAGDVKSFNLSSFLGCDSVVTVSVSALPITTSAITLQACPGTMANYNGSNLAIGTTQNFTFQNWLGCDSVVTVSVLALPNSSSSFSVGVCPGETYLYQGSNLVAGTVQSFTLKNVVGCDSVVTVTVFQKSISANVLNVSVCPGTSYSYAGESIAAGNSKVFHFANSEQCDSTVTVFVTALLETVFSVKANPSCRNISTGILEVSGIFGGPAPYSFSLNKVDYQDSTRFVGLAAGAYTVYVEDDNGCVAEQNLVVDAIPPLKIQLANGILPCDSPAVILAPTFLNGDPGNLKYTWWNGGRLPTNLATEAGDVWVEVSDACETVRAEAKVQWAELAKDQDIVYVPNVFKPSSKDFDNTEFKPLFAAGLTLLGFHFAVFDRWGNELFETSNTTEGWGGVFRDQKFNPGVQVWYLEADISICGRVLHLKRKGDVTVVR